MLIEKQHREEHAFNRTYEDVGMGWGIFDLLILYRMSSFAPAQ